MLRKLTLAATTLLAAAEALATAGTGTGAPEAGSFAAWLVGLFSWWPF